MKLLLLMAAAGCAFASQTVKTDELPADTLITLQRGACEKRCAVYNLVIFADGSVIYDGRYNVKRTGLIKSSITREALGALLKDVDAAGFYRLPDRLGYGSTAGCDSVLSDAPTAILSVATAGKSKTVLHDLRCKGKVPDQLKGLEERIDRAVNSVRWIK
ncbi:MAG: hypothetical protein HY820_14360 [Acidobacteria bacterium]|nr:hypothetical protein [Acidobacteriota bacterium]